MDDKTFQEVQTGLVSKIISRRNGLLEELIALASVHYNVAVNQLVLCEKIDADGVCRWWVEVKQNDSYK